MGARNAGNPHVACDVEGAGNVAWSRYIGLPARQFSTLLMSGEGRRIAHATPRLSSTLLFSVLKAYFLRTAEPRDHTAGPRTTGADGGVHPAVSLHAVRVRAGSFCRKHLTRRTRRTTERHGAVQMTNRWRPSFNSRATLPRAGLAMPVPRNAKHGECLRRLRKPALTPRAGPARRGVPMRG